MSHIRSIAPLTLAALALAVPGAAAEVPDASWPYMHSRAPQPAKVDLRSPDAVDGITKPEPTGIDLRTPDAQVGVRDVTDVAPVRGTRVVVVPQPGFEWGDAAIGAGAILALVLAGGGLVLTVRQRRTTAIGH
jgi:hypothetical protein